jgi:membrane-associated phospholipid phosphatase/predicted MFS family arabinose efflux permease
MSAVAATLPQPVRRPASLALVAFATVAVALGAARSITTTYVPVLLERIADRPGLIGAVMLVNAAAGFVVPLVTGVWSDRRGTRAPFILGGAILAAGGLVAVALGTASSYLVLALAAATVYIGLNAASTAHRALVAERFVADRRAAATGAQEGAMLAGALAGAVVGGALIDGSPQALFALWALALPLLALPTLAWQRSATRIESAPAERSEGSPRRLLAEVLRRDGVREVLIAQVLWVGSYAALAPFMVLYAEDVLGLRAAAAGLLLAGFGILTGAGMILGARLPAARQRRTLLAGVALLGGGLLAGAGASTLAEAALPFAAAALGAGLVSSVGFPYFTSFVPDGQAGRYAGAFFSVRAIASTAALPLAGLLISVTGSYRALLGMGALGLAALVPLARAERRRDQDGGGSAAATAAPVGPPVRTLAAVIPVFRSDRVTEVTAETLRHVDHVVLVDDGAPPRIAAALERLAADPRVQVVTLGGNHGKGTAVAAGAAVALERDPDAVIVLDSDGQHPAELIPAFAAAADHADVVIGDRPRADAMPVLRRIANATSSLALGVVVRRRLRDTQNGMRLFRARALRAVPLPDGRYEAETRHLKALIRDGREVGWVPMPAIYGGEPSSFRAVADTVRVARAVMAPNPQRPQPEPAPLPGAAALRGVVREWAPRIALAMMLAWTVAALFPLLAPADEQLFLAINGLGDGPEWLYRALDPHSRNYLLLAVAATFVVLATTRRLRFAAGALVAMAFAGVFSDLVLEVIQLAVDRPRPGETLGADVLLSHGRSWDHIPSFPSGHLIVTTALVLAATRIAPALRYPAFVYLAAIAVTRMSFGAHFPLDVALGTIAGWQVGLFAVALTRAAGLLPQESRAATNRRPLSAIRTPIVIPSAAPASTSSQK